MGIFDFLHRPAPPEILELPLFPLQTVLFPDGILSLKVFEQRYLDMVAACLRESIPFGVCLIASGAETGEPAVPHAVGTLAEIASCDMPRLGIMMVSVRGGRRFRIASHKAQPDRLLQATVEVLPTPPVVPVPEERERLLPFLRQVVDDRGREQVAEPYRFDDAEWVGCRITEILPVQNLAKQKLLELDDPLVRLEILEKYLDQRSLLG